MVGGNGLASVNHVVVLTLETCSFDHLLDSCIRATRHLPAGRL